ncbi:Zinc finger MYND domain-containing protein 15 [Mycena kentingensis (nom. inval.)]|nr:Zinc finger MYND domain-containing protein 15 [Mycena kentingensis (nom. inval.)]
MLQPIERAPRDPPNPFAHHIQRCTEFFARERSGKSRYADYSLSRMCRKCISVVEKASKCSACGTTFYCSKECQKADWKAQPWPHKGWCSILKASSQLQGQMNHLETCDSVIKSFPWGRVENDGTFYVEIVLVRHNLLGAAGFGFWSQSGLGLYTEGEDDKCLTMNPSNTPRFLEEMTEQRDRWRDIEFVNGNDLLLKKEHLDDRNGWRLSTDLIPLRDFLLNGSVQPPPQRTGILTNWDEWYKWRAIPKTRPAALLMHYPLTVYWMLVHSLGVAGHAIPSSKTRTKLTIHYIGAEIELNFLPIFSELALLLPQHDIEIVLFGPCVHRLGLRASAAGNTSLALAATRDPAVPIFSYTAPDSCGSGIINIFLHTKTKNWDTNVLDTMVVKHHRKPTAIVALNAGLFCYDASSALVHGAVLRRIPFVVSDYQEYMVMRNGIAIEGDRIAKEMKHRCGITELNPFHRPGQRHINNCVATPMLENGFILPVVTGA